MCLQSSVKINQISLDESGENVGICSEDGKVRHLCRIYQSTISITQICCKSGLRSSKKSSEFYKHILKRGGGVSPSFSFISHLSTCQSVFSCEWIPYPCSQSPPRSYLASHDHYYHASWVSQSRYAP